MAQQVFTIDGRAYNVRVMSLTRSFEVLDGENTGRTIAASCPLATMTSCGRSSARR